MHNAPINVGRGDPNWINTRARLAFNKLVEFGVEESAKKINEADGDMAGYVDKAGIAQRLHAYLDASHKTDRFILAFLDYTEKHMGLNQDDLVHEFVDGAIGNHYPVPSRSLINVEKNPK